MNKSSGKRVLITGLGIFSPCGNNYQDFQKSILKAKSGASNLNDLDMKGVPVHGACRISAFDPEEFIESKISRRISRCTQLAIAAAKTAAKDASIKFDVENPRRMRIIDGTTLGAIDVLSAQIGHFFTQSYKKMQPSTPIDSYFGTSSAQIAIHLGARSKSFSMCTGCSSSSDAIGLGYNMIKNGEADLIIAGGSEAPVVPVVMGSFIRTGVISLQKGDPATFMKPFSKDRDGFILGEGSAYLVLESEEHAKRRGVEKIYAELIGYEGLNDAYHMISLDPSADGIVEVTENAAIAGGFSLNEVTYLNAHGSATDMNDRTETKAIKRVFGKHSEKMLISGTKPLTGHLLGASGGVEAIICISVLANKRVPPTINLNHRDSECGLNYVPNTSQECESVNIAMSYAFGFGGTYSVLAFRRYR